MGNFENVREIVDLKEIYKDDPAAKLTAFLEGDSYYEENAKIIELTDYVCVYLHDNYLEQKNLIEKHINANTDYIDNIKTIFYSERCVTENNDNIFVSAYYCLDTLILDMGFYII